MFYEISTITQVVPAADKLMPYHKHSVGKLIHNSDTYYFQGQSESNFNT